MPGYEDWKISPHTKDSSLFHLSSYNMSRATEIMNCPDYTRALFLRDPKDRFMSCFFNNILRDDVSMKESCYNETRDCLKKAQTLSSFIELTQTCNDRRWIQQVQFMEQKYVSKLNLVGHIDTDEVDAKRLLVRIGAWEEYGKSDCGEHANESIFASKGDVLHATSNEISESWNRLSKFYSPSRKTALESYQADDCRSLEFNCQWRRSLTEKRLLIYHAPESIVLDYEEELWWSTRRQNDWMRT